MSLHDYRGLRLLSESDRHPKISKNGKVGVLTGILHFSPHNSSGYQVYPMASTGCIKSCLHHAGMQWNRKYEARLKRTKWFFADRHGFMEQLAKEVAALERRAKKLDLRASIRLNGTSDIPWENVPLFGFANIMEAFPDVAFHDYTKRYNRKNLPDNYKLVFSRSESNDEHCIEALKNGMNVAVVFADYLPEQYPIGDEMLPVIDGDEHDFRFGDYEIYDHRVVVGLVAKGKEARQDETGFVVRLP